MIDINDYFYFVKVVENRGYSSAARKLNISKSKISRHITKLEERLGHRLLQRTSRHFNTTEAGNSFYYLAKKVIDAMELAENSITKMDESISGTVSLSCSAAMANFFINELVIDFIEKNPEVIVKQNISNEYVNMIPAGLDMVVRGHRSNLPDSSNIQKIMARVEWYLFASPTFLSSINASITTPTDLIGLKAVGFGWQSTENKWVLQHRLEPSIEISYRPHFCSDDIWALKRAAEKDFGVVSLPSYVCKDEVNRGTLVRLLPEWVSDSTQLSLLIPSRKGVSKATKALLNHLCANAQRLVKTNF